jgi:hypothetical protein
VWWYSPGNTTVPLMKGGLLSPYTADFRVHIQRTSEPKSWPQESDKSTILVIELVFDVESAIPPSRCRGGLTPPDPPSAPFTHRAMTMTSEGDAKWTCWNFLK